MFIARSSIRDICWPLLCMLPSVPKFWCKQVLMREPSFWGPELRAISPGFSGSQQCNALKSFLNHIPDSEHLTEIHRNAVMVDGITDNSPEAFRKEENMAWGCYKAPHPFESRRTIVSAKMYWIISSVPGIILSSYMNQLIYLHKTLMKMSAIFIRIFFFQRGSLRWISSPKDKQLKSGLDGEMILLRRPWSPHKVRASCWPSFINIIPHKHMKSVSLGIYRFSMTRWMLEGGKKGRRKKRRSS